VRSTIMTHRTGVTQMNTEALAECLPSPSPTFHEGRDALSRSVLLSSEARNWPGIVVHKVHYAPGEVILPAPIDNGFGLQLFGSNRVQRRFLCDGARVTRAIAEPGVICTTPAGCGAWWKRDGQPEILHVSLRAHLYSRVALEAFDRDPAKTKLEPRFCIRDPLLERFGRLLLGELEKPGPGDRLYVESLASALAIHLLRHYSSGVKAEHRLNQGLPRPKLRRVIEYIEMHLEDGLSLEQMAQLTGYSAFHFARLFKAATGRSPHQYVIESRVARAQVLLKSSQTPTAEIAYAVGFSSQSHFVTAFRKAVGVTPKAYRGA
jgi:AraC family transcriptional regulator